MSTLYVDNLQPNLGNQVVIPDMKPLAGSVVQVVQDYKTNAVALNGVDVYHTVMSVTITPKDANSKMLISADVSYGYTPGEQQYEWYWYVDKVISGVATPVGIADADGARQRGWFQPPAFATGSGDSHMAMGTLSGKYLESPATSSPITYQLKFRSHTNTFYINRSAVDTNGSGYSKRLTSNLTVMEIAQ